MDLPLLLIVPILLPIIAGVLLLRLNFKERAARERYVGAVVIFNAVVTLFLAFSAPSKTLTLFSLNENLSFALKLDQFGAVFASLVSVLWVLASFYAFEYMKHEGMENRFMSFYTITLGVTLGIAFSANLITLYLFYEFLTLSTLPLIFHKGTKERIAAGRIYLLYSLIGAAAALLGIVFLYNASGTTDFVMGGLLSGVTKHADLLSGIYVAAFFGFGVKAAVFPLHGWLPVASVAPTPVTALLHAVAVVKSGVFAIARLTFFSFGTPFLRGTTAQRIVLAAAIITILYGSSMALYTKHLKRRLAYSTVSQLSYILLGITIMTPAGFTAGTLHLVVHAVAKITLFYCAGAILYKTGREYVWELHGIAKAMPITMGAFLIASLSLIGIPPFSGFFSKWQLIVSCVGEGSPFGLFGAVALVVSALLTVCYLLSICVYAYIPPQSFDSEKALCKVADPNRYMTVPLMLLSAFTLLFGLFAQPMTQFINGIAVK